jgi:uncharacterized protein YdcH (DUF465 family)
MHEALDKQIDGMEKTGKFDDVHLNNLKKQRLQLRDQLAELRRKQYEHDEEIGHDE